MVAAVTSKAYLEHLWSLMPRGSAWSRERISVLSNLLAAYAEGLADFDQSVSALLDDIRPDTTTDLLPEWEETLGLPDECSALQPTIELRRAAVLSKLISQANLNPKSYKAIGRLYGAEIKVHELDKARADAVPGIDTSDGRWRFVWWITISTEADVREFNALSNAFTPLVSIERITELECRLQKAKPAHTRLFVGYANFVSFELPEHTEVQADWLRWDGGGLGDVSALRDGDGDAWLAFVNMRGAANDATNRLLVQTGATERDTGGGSGPDLIPEWERSAQALLLEAPGLSPLIVAGPDNALIASRDTTEPYGWAPGADYANGAITYTGLDGTPGGLKKWVADFRTVHAADNAVRATITLST